MRVNISQSELLIVWIPWLINGWGGSEVSDHKGWGGGVQNFYISFGCCHDKELT